MRKTVSYTVKEIDPEQYSGTDTARAFKAVAGAIRMAKEELRDCMCPEQTMKDLLYGICTAAIEE